MGKRFVGVNMAKRKDLRKYIELAGVGILAFVGIFATLAIIGKKDYAGAAAKTEEILGTRAAVEALVNGESTAFGDAEKDVFDEFEKAYDLCSKNLEDLKSNNASKDDYVGSSLIDIEEELKKLSALNELERAFAGVAGKENLSDEELSALATTKNVWLAGFVKDLQDYRTAADELMAKYTDVDDYDKKAMEEDFGNVQLIGRELAKKYENADLSAMLGFEKSEIWKFYDKVEELNKYLADKK